MTVLISLVFITCPKDENFADVLSIMITIVLGNPL